MPPSPAPTRKRLRALERLPPAEESAVVVALDEQDERAHQRHQELVEELRGTRVELGANRRATSFTVGLVVSGALGLAFVSVLALAYTRGVDIEAVTDGASKLTPALPADVEELGESPATEEIPPVPPIAPGLAGPRALLAHPAAAATSASRESEE